MFTISRSSIRKFGSSLVKLKGLQSGLDLTSLKRLHTSLSHFFDRSLERRLELRRVAFGLGYRLKVTPLLIVQFLFDGFDLPVQLNLRHPFALSVNSSEVVLACIQAPVKCQKRPNLSRVLPIQRMAMRFGVLVDQFGTPWTINRGKPR
jgi:hypothetical protein